MKDEQDIIITLGKMNNRYERFNLVDDSFTLEMKDLIGYHYILKIKNNKPLKLGLLYYII